MTNLGKERMRADIAEAFDFMRFLLKNPGMLKKIRDGSAIRIRQGRKIMPKPE